MTAYRDLVSRFDESPCSMMFGLVELPYTSHSCVLMDRYRNIGMIRDKEEGFSSWICAIWNLEFTEFLHKKIQDGVFDFAEICNSFFAENSAQGRVVAETFYDILDLRGVKMISVVLPYYNDPMIASCLSALMLNVRDLESELIVVDNTGSGKTVSGKCRSYYCQFGKLWVLRGHESRD
jgi:hypothetical protein